MRLKPSIRLARAFAFAALAVVLCGFTPDDNLKAELQARYDEKKVAFEKHDYATLRAILTPDYTVQYPAGNVKNIDQVLEDSKNSAQAQNVTRIFNKIELHDNTVTVQLELHSRTTTKNSLNLYSTVESTLPLTDTWVKTQNIWYLQKTVMSKPVYVVDGVAASPVKKP